MKDRKRRHIVVIPVQDRQPSLGKTVENLALGPKDILPAAQIPDVSFSDIRNHSNLRVCHPGQGIDFSQMIHPHLHHSHLGLTGDL